MPAAPYMATPVNAAPAGAWSQPPMPQALMPQSPSPMSQNLGPQFHSPPLSAPQSAEPIDEPQRPANSSAQRFGFASLAFAVVALGVCWVPLGELPTGVLALAPAAIGLVLGIAGFTAAMGRGATGWGTSFGGGFVSALVLVVAGLSCLGTFGTLDWFPDRYVAPEPPKPTPVPLAKMKPVEVLGPAPLNAPRWWTIDGRRTLGTLKAWSPGRVVLTAADRTEITISPQRLSAEDRAWVMERAR